MARLVWTPPALRDVARLHSFLAERNPDAARRAVRAIRQGVKTLAAHPEIGRHVEELPSESREWFIRFGNSFYVTMYRYDGEQITILAVRHGRGAASDLTRDAPTPAPRGASAPPGRDEATAPSRTRKHSLASIQSYVNHRPAASALSSGRVLNAMAEAGAAL